MKHNFTKIGLILSGVIAITSCASSCSPTTSATTSIYKSGSVTLITGKTIGKDKHGMPTYTDKSRTRLLRATAYSHMEKEVGAPGRNFYSHLLLPTNREVVTSVCASSAQKLSSL